MIPDSPVNAGHAFATAAEDFEDREEWAEAAEAHQKAADKKRGTYSNILSVQDPNQAVKASKTLSLLTSNHLRKAKELDRRVARQKSERKQVVQVGENHRHNAAATEDRNDDDLNNGPYDMESLRLALSSDRRRVGDHNSGSVTPTIGGSYAVLPTDTDISGAQDEDAADPFNNFFKVVEALVDKLSNPIAFASAPLNENDKPTPAWSTQNEHSDEEDEHYGLKMQESYFFVAEPTKSVMMSSSVPAMSVTNDLVSENEQLKQQVDQLQKRVHALEKAAEEGHMLKSSILQFRTDVHNHAKRIMQNHDHLAMRASSSAALMVGSLNTRPPLGDHIARVRELEEENRQLRLQNEKQQAMETAMVTPAKGFSVCSAEDGRVQHKQQQQPVLLLSLAQQAGLSGIYTRTPTSFSKDSQ
ncbi:hypothetical protein BX666DRAFT_2024507 [Dichotomocladium elegans]|nr:hypothetical protein BX666DRAFT_2024507 [Dichotomocladium elegans]